jgi:6-phosphogluconolactonase (cycloisomerase 2 family)
VAYWKGEVYIALRGDDKIIAFKDLKDRLEQKIAWKVGKWPRHFSITEYGVMHVTCQNENKVFRYLFK